MATITAAAGGGNWTTGATWTGGSAPTAADDAVLGAGSGNVTVDSGAVCRSLDANAYTGTLTHTAGVTLTIGDATAGASNRALRLGSGMTYTLGNAATSAISFISTSATQQTIDYAGKTHGNVSFAGATGNFAVTTALTQGAGANLTSTSGALHLDGATDNAGLSHTIGLFVATSTTARHIWWGACTLNLLGSGTSSDTIVNITTSLNLTRHGGSESWVLVDNDNTHLHIYNWGGGTYGNVSVTGNCGTTMSGRADVYTVFNNMTRIPGVAPYRLNPAVYRSFEATHLFRILGTLSIQGISHAVPGQLSTTDNGRRPILDVTTTTFDTPYTNFWDVEFITPNVIDLSAQNCANLGGVTVTGGGSIIFPAPVTHHWNNPAGGNWSEPTNWREGTIPSSQDPVEFDAAITMVGNPNVVADCAWACGSFTVSDAGGNFVLRLDAATTNLQDFMTSGNIRLSPRMTLTCVNSNDYFYCNSRDTPATFTANGATLTGGRFNMSTAWGGQFTFMDNVSLPSSFLVRNGIYVIPLGIVVSSLAFTSNASSSTAPTDLRIYGELRLSTSSGTTFNFGTAGVGRNVAGDYGGKVVFTNTGVSAKTFVGNGHTMQAKLETLGGSGGITITGANTLGAISAPSGGKFTLPGSATTIMSGANPGNGSNVLTLVPSAGSATVSFPSTANWDYLALTNIVSVTTAYAGTHSTDSGGNTNWLFTEAPAPDVQYLADGALHLMNGATVLIAGPAPGNSFMWQGWRRDAQGRGYAMLAPQTISYRHNGRAYTIDGSLVYTTANPTVADSMWDGVKSRTDGTVYVATASSTDYMASGNRLSVNGQLVVSGL
jgi:hypothetical protein